MNLNVQSKWIVASSLLVLTLVAFWPAQNNDFIFFDDDVYVFENPHVNQGLTWKGFQWAMTAELFSDSLHADFWIPITYLSHQATVQVFGLDPWGHHWVNVGIHLLNVLLLFIILARVTGAIWPSAFVAAVFAVHPLRVESVAWITERKDLLSAFFWFLSMEAYFRYAQKPNPWRYLLLLLFCLLGLMSKPMTVTLPFALLLLDLWPLSRISFSQNVDPSTLIRKIRQLLWEKFPLFLLVGLYSALTFITVRRSGSLYGIESHTMTERIQNMVFSYVRYIGKMLWPKDLAVFYPLDPESFQAWPLLGAAVLLLAVSTASILVIRSRPYIAMGWFWYLGILVPIIGIAQVGDQALADRYSYLPMIGLSIIVAWGVREVTTGWTYQALILAGASLIIVLLYSVATRAQLHHWRDSVSLFDHAMRVTGENIKMLNNLGIAHHRAGRLDEAIRQYERALQIRPNFPDGHHNLGLALAGQGNYQEAILEYRIALSLKPNFPRALRHLGESLHAQERSEEAIQAYREALSQNPQDALSHIRLGDVLKDQGDTSQAIQHFRLALASRPGSAETHNKLGEALMDQGDIQGAVSEFQKVVSMLPDLAEGHNNLAGAFLLSGRIQDAIEEYEIAFRLRKDRVIAYNLGLAYQRTGQIMRARLVFQEALKIDPEFLPAEEALRHLPE